MNLMWIETSGANGTSKNEKKILILSKINNKNFIGWNS